MMDNEMKLLLRSFDDDLDERDRRRLEDILDESATLRRERVHLLRLRDLVAGTAEDRFPPGFTDRVMREIDRASDGARERGNGPGANGTHAYRPDRHANHTDRPALRRWSWRLAGGVAAAAVLAIAIGLMMWMQPRVSSVPNGATQTLTLSDGSTVTLSGGSTLSYPRMWSDTERRVRLDGEAFFDVEPADRPFVVETFNADITVLGTQFNVRAWRDDPMPETAVALATGRVSVTARAGEGTTVPEAFSVPSLASDSAGVQALRDRSTVLLEPGQSTSVVADSTAARAPRNVSLDPILSWRYGGLAFVDQPLGSVFNTIERRFGTDVHAADAAIRERLLTYLNPDPRSAEEVLSDICHTLNLRYRRTADGFEVLPE